MQTATSNIFIKGIFRRELKNRFLCEVEIEDKSVVCYVPSSCHLSNFLQLEGKEVLLVPTQAPKSRTPYALFAVPYKRNYIVLNTSMANRALENSIQGKRFAYLGSRNDILKEHIVEGYKSDLYIPSTKTIVEVKSVISLSNNAKFPTVYSERTIKQLKQIHQLLQKGYKVCFVIISLHPYIKNITINKNSEFYSALETCIGDGMTIRAYTSRLENGNLTIMKEINITYYGD